MGFPSTSTYDGQYGNQHQAKVSSFFIGKYEVTQAQWRVVASLPKVNMDLYTNPAFFKGDNLPVEQVSWDEAIEFCVRLSRKTGRVYSLPSETEWEYACRTETNRSFSKGRTIVDWINSNSSKQRVETFPFGFGSTITPEIVNYNGSRPFGSGPIGINRQKTVPVGSLSVTNAFGLFDLHGNVEEWCLDGGSEYRVMRGGSWKSDGTQCRSASRRFEERDTKDSTLGLRVVCEASIKQ